MIEDPLAEALLIGRYSAGDTLYVTRGEEAGLSISTLAEKTPVGAS
jgi:hypothetical protein